MMRKPMTYPHREGVCSRQAHADLPKDAIYEREVGQEGFYGPATHFHHQHPPTAWCDWQGELRPRCFNLNHLDSERDVPWGAAALLHNQQCKIRTWRLNQPMTHLVRNADGDELLFIHQGQGDVYCDYGHITLKPGDYLLIPRSTMWRIEPSQAMFILMIECTDSHYQLPDKGLLGQHAIFDPAVLEVPKINHAFQLQYSEHTTQVYVKRHDKMNVITFPFNPLDAIGWHGDLAVAKLNWRDIRPLSSHRYHLPPSAHTTFVASDFVVCTFVPRPIESDPGALKVPFFHNNDDYDEVLFYHSGDFFSRDNIEPGMMTFHPAGFTHGPHPKAFESGQRHAKTFTDEVAVMIDTRHALMVDEQASGVENTDYISSWQ